MIKPKMVTFDVYMALLDIEGSLVPIVGEVLSLDLTAASAFVRTWRAKQMERAAISNSLGGERVSFRDATRMGLDYLARRDGLNLDHATQEKLVFAWDQLRPWLEADEAIAAIKAKGYLTAILSNGDQNMLEAVATQFESGFDYILSSETAGKYKPHPAVYDLPTRVLGIPKDQVLHVAGSANDVLGAISAGMQCVWSNRHSDVVLDPAFPPTRELFNLSGLPDILS